MSRWTPPQIAYDPTIGTFRRQDPPITPKLAPADNVRRLLIEAFRDSDSTAGRALNVPAHLRPYIQEQK